MDPLARDRYGFSNAPRFPHVARNVGGVDFWEVPLGTARFAGVNLPLGGGFLRWFPATLVHAAVASVNAREQRPVVLDVQPLDLEFPPPRAARILVQRLRRRTDVVIAERKLARLLAAFTFASIETAFEQVRAPRRVAVRAS
jgi:Domain of unknown function (DUF3473)